jgi:ABC-2 type transport system permease protein
MTAAQRIFLLAKRDFTQRLKSRAFVFSTLLVIGLALAVGPIIGLAQGGDKPSVIALVGQQPTGSEQSIEQQAEILNTNIELKKFNDLAAAETALTNGDVAVVVNGTSELVYDKEPSLQLSAIVTNGIATAQRVINAADLGLSDAQLGSLLAPVNLSERTLETTDLSRDNAKQAAAFVALMLLYLSILMFGQFVMMGVMEEKQTRVVEVVLSRVKPTDVLIGKVLGIGLLGLVQIVALGGALLFTVSTADLADFDFSGLGIKVFGLLIMWYLLGYAFYSFMYGSLGATISRQEDVQGVALLPVLLILPGFFFGQIALLEPDLLLTRITSLIPVWSPMVMAVRSTAGDVPMWEVLLAIVLILVTTVLLVILGGRIYRGAILQSGKKTRLRTAWKSARG